MQKMQVVQIQQPEWLMDLGKVSGTLLNTLENLTENSSESQKELANTQALIAGKIIDIARTQIQQGELCLKLYNAAKNV
ncbi:MAG: hypothetical protein ACOVOV_02570 [Dolichospermum sp.]